MSQSDAKLYIEGTVEAFSKQLKKKLVEWFISDGIALKGNPSQKSLDKDKVVVDNTMDVTLQIGMCFQHPRALRSFENWEMDKHYRYSIPYAINAKISDSALNDLADRGKLNKPSDTDLDILHNMPTMPSMHKSGDKIIFKFCLKKHFTDLDGEDQFRKYTILLIVHKVLDIVEIRYDQIVTQLNTSNFYLTNVNFVKKWAEDNLEIKLLDPLYDSIALQLEKASLVRITGQSMKFANGSQAELFVGSNNHELPFVDGLTEIIRTFDAQLAKTPELREALEAFVKNAKEDADYPWIQIKWLKEVAPSEIQIRILANYGGLGTCRCYHFANPMLDGRSMDYVTEQFKHYSSHTQQDGIT